MAKKHGLDKTNAKKDVSIKVYQRDKIKFDLKINQRGDLTEKQKLILETATHKDTRCVMIDGVWGSAKSYTLILAALRLLNSRKVSNVYYIRNPVPASAHSKVGYLSGDLNEKMAPYNAVLFDKLEELLPADDINRLMKEDRLECLPTGFLQGRSFNCSVLIVDEAASMSWEDLMLIISRCGEFTRIFFAGDTLNQVYLSNQSGYQRFFQLFSDEESAINGVHTFELKQSMDIVRSGFLQFVMRKVGIIKR